MLGASDTDICSTASLISLPTQQDYSNIPLQDHTHPYSLQTTEDQPRNLKTYLRWFIWIFQNNENFTCG